jgi:hypothetical protein
MDNELYLQKLLEISHNTREYAVTTVILDAQRKAASEKYWNKSVAAMVVANYKRPKMSKMKLNLEFLDYEINHDGRVRHGPSQRGETDE